MELYFRSPTGALCGPYDDRAEYEADLAECTGGRVDAIAHREHAPVEELTPQEASFLRATVTDRV